MDRERKNEMEQDILVNAIREELDFVCYVEMDTERVHTIITNEKTDVMPPEAGDYTEVNQKNIPLFVHPEDQEYCMRVLDLSNLKKELETKERILVAYRLLCKKQYRRKELNIYYQAPDKKVLVLIRRDVTATYEEEQKQKEQIYHALMEARHANQEKNEFLERMSHEIRTPMNSIIGLSYLSRENAENKKQVLENLDKIDLSAHFLLSFIDDILNLSQIESGNIALNEEDADFDDFLSELCHDVEGKAEEKRIHFSLEKRGDFQKEYRFDADKLGKALRNVLQNAVKFTPVEGQIDFIAELLRETERDVTLRFEVRDNGCGIDAASLPRVFEPFWQENEGKTTLTGGTGLGLAIARNIVEYMGGKIDGYSEKGKGATFVTTVKVKKVEDNERSLRKQKQSAQLDYDFTGKRVLLVEDNEINVEITRNILIHKNFEVEVAMNGEECLEKFLQHEAGYFDVILMDIRMPVMDGLTATRKIRASEHDDHSRIPIIAMTANAFEEDVKKSFEAGMDGHLSKPVDIRQMYAMLDEVIFG